MTVLARPGFTQHRARTTRGFSLLESMVAIFILSILVSLAVPAMRGLILNQKVRNASFDLSTAFMFARSEASKRRNDVVVAPVGGQWQNGWTVSVSGTVLRQQDPYSDITINGNVTGVTYNPTGRLTAAGTPTFNLNSIQSATMVSPRCVTIELSGKVSNTC